MATNWVKDGLDSYLALTGEHRAEAKAASDLQYQKDSMQLSKNADSRAAASAGLANQLTGLQINDAQFKDDERKGHDDRLKNYIRIKEHGHMPSSVDDVAGIAANTQEATDLIQTAGDLKSLPTGASEHDLSELPDYTQRVILAGPGKAAEQRKGEVHTDPLTGQNYTMTGKLGKLQMVKEDGTSPTVVPTMLAMNDDGTVRQVPFTPDKTNSPDSTVSSVDADMLATRGALKLSAIQKAQANGTSPADESANHIYQMLKTMPYEEQKKWMSQDMEKSMSRTETAAYDAGVAKAAEPYMEKVNNLKGTAAEREAQFLAVTKGAPATVIAYLTSNATAAGKLFEGQAKREATAEDKEANRISREQISKDHNKTWLTITSLLKSNKDGGGELKPRERLLSIDKSTKELHVDTRALRKELNLALDSEKPAIQALLDENARAEENLNAQKAEVLGVKPPKRKPTADDLDIGDGRQSPIPPKGQQPVPAVPAAKGMSPTVDMSGAGNDLSAGVAYLRGGSGKPSSNVNNGMSNHILGF